MSALLPKADIVDTQTTLFQLEISTDRGRQSGNHMDARAGTAS
jgi:hypothetical protein